MTFLANPLNRVLLLVAAAILIGFLGFVELIQPKQQQFAASQQQLAQDNQTYADLKRVADQRPEYLALQNQVMERLQNVEKSADPRVYIPSYLKQIEDRARLDGLEITSVTPVATPAPSATATPAPGGAPAPVHNNAFIQGAANAAGAQVQNTESTQIAAANGVTPAPAPGSNATAAPGHGAPAQSAQSSARAKAIAYLNESFTQETINMELAGTFTQLEQFLRDLNKFQKLVGVGNVTLAPGAHTGVGETPTLTITMPITAYRLVQGANAAPTPAPAAPGNGS